MAQMVFWTCVLKISNHFIHFSLSNNKLNVKKKKKNLSHDKGAWLVASKSRDPCLGRREIKSPEGSVIRYLASSLRVYG